MTTSLVGLVGGAAGSDPFDRRSWSGSSYYFFDELRARGVLKRATGVTASTLPRAAAAARTFSLNRTVWRDRFHLDLPHRHALTAQVRQQLRPGDLGSDILQIGGYFDGPAAASSLEQPPRCFAYYDGNLIERQRSPYPIIGLSARTIDRAIEFERELCSRLDAVFTMSDYLKASFIKDYGVSADRVFTIGGGCNRDEIPAFRPDKSYARPQILFVGAAFERKGGWVLLEAFDRVRRRITDAELHVVGPADLDLGRHAVEGVTLHGYLDRNSTQFRELLDSSSLFAMPSLFEAFGIAPIEAMLHQIPAVVTDRWALGEMVEPNVTGALVPVGDARQLADVLTDLLVDPTKLREMGSRARQTVLSKYTWTSVVDRLIDARDSLPS